MIIDLILDRKDGGHYDAGKFYFGVMDYRNTFPTLSDPITLAMDYGTEEDVRKELCLYIDKCHYNAEIKDYINSVNWLKESYK